MRYRRAGSQYCNVATLLYTPSLSSIMTQLKTAIVTGVTGQMGSYMAEFLLAKGIKVVGTVRRLSVPNRTNLDHIKHADFSVAPMDLCDSHSINRLVETLRPDYFINCAANSFVGSSWDYPEQHMDYNALGVLRQLEAIKRFSPQTRYLNFGSSEEFGDVAYSPQDEKHPGRARSPYGASKIAARQIVKVYRESFGLYAIQCWCFNYESERRGEEFVTRKITLGVARIARAIKDGQPFKPIELGNIDAKRDWSHAEDFVDGIWRMMNQDKYTRWPAIGHMTELAASRFASDRIEEYVLSSNETHTVREFIEKAFAMANIGGSWFNLSGKPESEEYLRHVASSPELALVANINVCSGQLVRINSAFYRPAEVDLLLGNSTRARIELGWSPKVSFDELVRRMVTSDLKAVGL